MNRISMPLAPTLDQLERELMSCKNGDMVKSIAENDLKKNLIVLITKTYLECGYMMDSNNVNMTIVSLSETISKYFGTLTMSEIEKAFKLGVMGEFGEWQGLSNKTYLQWCKGYMGWQKRTEANKKQATYNAELTKPKELTQSEKDKIIHDGLLICFESYKKNRILNDYGNVNYNYLDRLKLIPLTIERKKEMFKQAEVNVRAELMRNLNTSCESKAKTIKDELENLNPDKIKSEAKRLALIDLFNSLIETETEIDDLLNK